MLSTSPQPAPSKLELSLVENTVRLMWEELSEVIADELNLRTGKRVTPTVMGFGENWQLHFSFAGAPASSPKDMLFAFAPASQTVPWTGKNSGFSVRPGSTPNVPIETYQEIIQERFPSVVANYSDRMFHVGFS